MTERSGRHSGRHKRTRELEHAKVTAFVIGAAVMLFLGTFVAASTADAHVSTIDRQRVAAVRKLEAMGYTFAAGDWMQPATMRRRWLFGQARRGVFAGCKRKRLTAGKALNEQPRDGWQQGLAAKGACLQTSSDLV